MRTVVCSHRVLLPPFGAGRRFAPTFWRPESNVKDPLRDHENKHVASAAELSTGDTDAAIDAILEEHATKTYGIPRATLKNAEMRARRNFGLAKRSKGAKRRHRLNLELDEQRDYDNANVDSFAPSSPRQRRRSATVYSPLNGRVVSTSSNHVQTLALIGITPVDGVLCVTDHAALNEFASDLRGRRATIPLSWPATMRKRIAPILLNTSVSNPAQAISDLLNALDRQRTLNSQSQLGLIGDPDGADQDADVTPEEHLNEGQKIVLKLARLGYSMYIGGTAGTGKTVLLRAIRRALRCMHLSVGTTATTGLASAHLGGVTFHSFFKLNTYGEFGGSATSDAAKPKFSGLNVDVLIVDEISMMDRYLLEGVDRYLRLARGRPLSLFGGVQVIVCGDFLQLEPVSSSLRGPNGRPLRPQPAFMSPIFTHHLVHVQLTQQVRQSSDPAFGEALLSLRRGVWPAAFSGVIKMLTYEEGVAALAANAAADLDAAAVALEGKTSQPPIPTDAVQTRGIPRKALHLVARNREAAALNEARVAMLPGEAHTIRPCPQAPTVSGQWTPSVLLQVKVNSFDAPVFRKRCRAWLAKAIRSLPTIDTTTSSAATSPPSNGGGDAEDKGSLLSPIMPFEVEQLLEAPTMYFVMYPFMQDGYVLRMRIPLSSQLRPNARQHLRALWASMIKEIPALSDANAGVVDVRDSADGLQTPEIEEALTKTLEAHPVAGQTLCLKVGMEVMLRINLTRLLINGSVGVVTGFVPAAAENIDGMFKSIPNIYTVLEAYNAQQKFIHGVDIPLMPLVQFRGVALPGNATSVAIPPCAITAGGDVLTQFYDISSVCLPLVPAYAFTIHKVQGMTLGGDVHIALGRMWRCHHIVYVALSRVRRASQLTLSGFHPKLISVNLDCVKFDTAVSDADAVREDDIRTRGYPMADWALERARCEGNPVVEVKVPPVRIPAPEEVRHLEQSVSRRLLGTANSVNLVNLARNNASAHPELTKSLEAQQRAINLIAADDPAADPSEDHCRPWSEEDEMAHTDY